MVEALISGRLELLELGDEVGLAALKSRDLPRECCRAFLDVVAGGGGSVFLRGQESGACFAEDPSLEEAVEQRDDLVFANGHVRRMGVEPWEMRVVPWLRCAPVVRALVHGVAPHASVAERVA
ncbi:hypothetical protein ODJ79_38350 [Actinoplanes sp. KI2]|uniref:hypothetical protein n=1 Tax=Actinoplanes sp. KI2 TaxID=2983315 RepID=UPI0021D5DA56|nr:hypothetical protein [Actinoplanes sp. KI2]MCU7729613.1 hypothetical protein [Actinoplanes sp. KI2]